MEVYLYYGNLKVGKLNGGTNEFPFFTADFERLLQTEAGDAALILQYIAFSKRLSAAHLKQASEEELAVLNKEEEQFAVLINSLEWHIQESNGCITRILVPVFDGKQVDWRLQ